MRAPAAAALVLFACSQLSVATVAAGQRSGPTLLPIVLPDLGGMHPAVQQQLRQAYALVMTVAAANQQAGTPPSERRRHEGSDAYGTMGKLLMASRYPDEAGRCFANAQMLAPDDYRWPYYLGQISISQGALETAVKHFKQVLGIRPTDFPTLVWLGDVYMQLGQPEAADNVLTSARALDPDNAAVLYQLGRASLARRDFGRAVEYLEQTLRLNPDAAAVHYPLAMAYRGAGDLEKAQSNLDRANGRGGAGATVTIPDPLMAEVNTALRSPEVLAELGQQAGARGEWSAAVARFRSAIELAPENAMLRVSLADVLIRSGNPEAAQIELRAAVRVDPALAAAHFMLGVLLQRTGRNSEAVNEYNAAVTQNPRLREGHLRLAEGLRRMDRPAEALSSYRRVLEIDPESDEARLGEAVTLARLSRYAEARQRLHAAMDLHPHQPAFAEALARLLAAAPDPAVRDGQRALELVQTLASEHKTTSVAETMAMALAELGRFAEAAEWQRLAISVATDAGEAAAAGRMAANLALYERHEPCRTPWREDDLSLGRPSL